MTTLILVSLVGISITQAGKLAIATGEAGFSTMTRLIANNAAGGIRWNKPDAIESAYIEFATRSEEHTSELQSLMRISYAVFCLKKKNTETKTRKKNIRSH